jgi:hypothetical protein
MSSYYMKIEPLNVSVQQCVSQMRFAVPVPVEDVCSYKTTAPTGPECVMSTIKRWDLTRKSAAPHTLCELCHERGREYTSSGQCNVWRTDSASHHRLISCSAWLRVLPYTAVVITSELRNLRIMR